ncbi:MAG TPA: low temperature requirement protein A [Micromonosporaceae bacterium]
MPTARYLPLVARDTTEQHRASTPLELLFDLCFVVGVSQAGTRLHHSLSAGEIGHGIGSYLMLFFAIWWAWVNFTWFASAYDNDDVPYRLTTLVQITGALILAAGVPRAFDNNDFTVVVIGYVVMRLAMVGQWLRAARSDPPRRRTALRFAIGITIVQVCWIARLWLPSNLAVASFLVLVLAELLVPIVAEHAEHTTWHAEHIAERYGLFTLIVLGESILASTTAVQTAFDTGLHTDSLLVLTGAGLLIVFGMWWLYFDRPGQDALSVISGFVWGYGHYLIFASAAAVGAGIVTNVDLDEHLGHLSRRGAAFAVAIPVAVYLVNVWWLHNRPAYALDGRSYSVVKAWALPAGAALILLAPLLPAALPIIAAIMVVLVVIKTAAAPVPAR